MITHVYTKLFRTHFNQFSGYILIFAKPRSKLIIYTRILHVTLIFKFDTRNNSKLVEVECTLD